MREAFNLFDRDRSGSISVKEMKSVFLALGVVATDQEIKSVVKEMDDDSNSNFKIQFKKFYIIEMNKDDGEINFEEFVKVMGNQFYKQYNEAEIKAAFK